MKKKPENRNWRRAFVDFIGITFSVLLAFMLNEWRLNVRQSQDLDVSKSSIYAELEKNHGALLKARDYHLDLYRQLQDFQAGRITREEFNFRGMQPPQLQMAAYKVAIQKGTLTNLPTDELQEISEAYTRLESVQKLHAVYSQGAISNMAQMYENDVFMQGFMGSALQDFLYGQEETMLQIADVIETSEFERWFVEIKKPVSD